MKKEIKAYFKKNPSDKLKARDLAKRLFIKDSHEITKLKQVLHDLFKEDFLIKTGKRFSLNAASIERLQGTLQVVAEGNFGFVLTKNEKYKDIFVPTKFMGDAFSGDIVEVELIDKKKGKNFEGKITKVIERKNEKVLGTLKKAEGGYLLVPDESNFRKEIYIRKKDLNGAKENDKVLVSEIDWESNNKELFGKITEIYGQSGTYDAEIASIAHEFNLNFTFPKEVEKQLREISTDVDNNELSKRIDFRNITTFTIDPEDAKDYDDALSIEKLETGNFKIGIHIADVSHYVTPGSAIYNEALNRGTSVYIVGKVIPMLPEKLSNQICSLVPNEDRLTYSVIVEITPRAKVVNYEIAKTIINSDNRFTYEEVQEILDSGKGKFNSELLTFNKIAKQLRKKRLTSGSINFHTPEVKFNIDESGTPISVEIKVIQESNNLIEEYMLLANRIVAEHIAKNPKKIPFVYRVHDLPDEEKLFEFGRFVNSLGYKFDIGSENHSKQFQFLLEQVEGTAEEAVVNEVAIRSMAKAIYDIENIGHYGLAFKYYTHFTSPIRRFPDLIVHRVLFEFLTTKKVSFSFNELEEICDHASAMERNAVNAERLSVKLKQMEYLKNKIGDEFQAVISGITNFGIFVELNETLSEGLIRYKDLDDDYYLFDEKNYSVVGRKYGRKFRLGDKIQVKLVRIDEQKREIDFILLD